MKKILSMFINENLVKEKQLVESVQRMINHCIFNDTFNKRLFDEKLRKYTHLKENLYQYDDTNYFGKFRVSDHHINNNLINLNDSRVEDLKKNKVWDHEFLDMCIEDLEVEIDLLEDRSYDELYEDSLSM